MLAGGTHYEYQPATQAMLDRVARIRRICERFGVDVRAVALQFSLAHPAVAAAIPGASRPDRIDDNLRLAAASIPAELWDTLKAERLIAALAPTPVGPDRG